MDKTNKTFIIQKNVLTQYIGKDSSVTVENGITAIGKSAFSWKKNLTTVTLPEGVEVIGESAFHFCDKLERVNLPQSVVCIDNNSFGFCKKLNQIELPRSLKIIGHGAFTACHSLKNVVISSGTEIIGSSAFKSCIALKTVSLPESVKRIGCDAFNSCHNLKFNTFHNGLYLGNENNPYLALVSTKSKKIAQCLVHKNTKIICGGAFQDCIFLFDVKLSGNVKFIGEKAFYGCNSLKSINIPEGVEEIDDSAFDNCPSLENIALPSSLESLGERSLGGCKSVIFNQYADAQYLGNEKEPYMVLIKGKRKKAEECKIHPSTKFIYDFAFKKFSFSRIEIPDGIISIGRYAFTGCSKLTRIKAPESFHEKWVTWWKDRFEEDTLPLIALDNYDKKTKITAYVIKEKIFSLKAIMQKNRIDLLYKLLEYSPRISLEKLDEMIETARNEAHTEASSILIAHKNKLYPASRIEEIEQVKFEKAIGLKEYTISDWRKTFKLRNFSDSIIVSGYKIKSENVFIPDSIEGKPIIEIGKNAFRGCEFIKNVTIPQNVSVISNEAFSGCHSLEEIELNANLKSIGDDSFSHCHSLKNIILPASVAHVGKRAFFWCSSLESITLGEELTEISENMFCSCFVLKNIELPKSLTAIKSQAFYSCKNLESITIPENVTSIEPHAFYNCVSLKNVNIPSGVKRLEYGVFSYCHSLAEFVVPPQIESISDFAFKYCTALKKITITSPSTQIARDAFEGCAKFVIECKKGSLAERYAKSRRIPTQII